MRSDSGDWSSQRLVGQCCTIRYQSGWQGACLVAITYVYFLIFAQFAFLKRLANLGVADAHLKVVMAAMAVGGHLSSLLAPRFNLWPSPSLRLRVGLLACGLGGIPVASPAALRSRASAFLIGAGLGLLTVTLVTHLRQCRRRKQSAPCRRRGNWRGLSDLQPSRLLHHLC